MQNDFIEGAEAAASIAVEVLRAVLTGHFGDIESSALAMSILEDFDESLTERI